MADVGEAIDAVLGAIKSEASDQHGPGYAARARDLAEAYAWLQYPNNAHGTGSGGAS